MPPCRAPIVRPLLLLLLLLLLLACWSGSGAAALVVQASPGGTAALSGVGNSHAVLPRAALEVQPQQLSTTSSSRRNASRMLLSAAGIAEQQQQSQQPAPAPPQQQQPSLLPVSPVEVAVLVCAGVVLFIAAGAGMGGGPLLVPLYLCAGLGSTAAVALSNASILSGSVANVAVNSRKRHPWRDKPLIDFDLVLLMQPPTLVGAIAGSFLNKLLPGWVTASLLTLLLALMTVRVVQRARRIYASESAARCQQAAATAPAAPAPEQQQQQQHQQAARAGQAVSDAPCRSAAVRPGSAGSPAGFVQQPGSEGGTQRLLSAAAGRLSHTGAGASSGGGGGGLPPPSPQQRQQQQQQQQAPSRSTPFACSATPPLPPPPRAMTGGSVDGSGSTTPPPRQHRNSSPLSHVPSSVLLTVQLEGNLSEAQVQRLAALDGADLSHASMDGAAGPDMHALVELQAWRRQQQQQHRQELQQPPSEAECRLAYAPPGHVRRDSWEDWEHAWRDEQQQQAQSQQQPQQRRTGSQQPAPQDAAAVPVPAAAAAVPAAAGLPPAPGLARSAVSTSGGGGGASAGGGGPERSGASRAALLPAAAAASAPEMAQQDRQVAALLDEERRQLPPMPLVLLFASFVSVLLCSLLSKLAPCGSAAYWLAQAAVVPALAAIWAFSRRRTLAKAALKKAARMDHRGDVAWTPRKTIIFPAICSLAGVMAGLLGLGGAAVLTPLMLELGVNPLVTAATTQTMLLLTSAAASVVYAQLGVTPWDYAAVMMPVALAATLAGQICIDALVRRLGRSSVVVLVLAVFFVAATGLSVYTLAVAARAVAAHPELLGRIRHICS